MVKCYYCWRYKPIEKMKQVIVGRGKNSTAGTKDGIDFVHSCGCFEKRLKRPTIDYLIDGKIKTVHLKNQDGGAKG